MCLTCSPRTGRVAFDAMGDRVFAEYKIINIRRVAGPARTKQVTVGNFSYNNVTHDTLGEFEVKFCILGNIFDGPVY